MKAAADIVAAMAALPGMERLTDDERHALADRLTPREFAPGDVILRAGDAGTTVHLVVEGDIVVTTPSGIEIGHRGPGCIIGAVAFTLRVPRTATCTAVTATRTAELDETVADLLFTVDPAIGVAVELALGAQLGNDFRSTAEALARHGG